MTQEKLSTPEKSNAEAHLRQVRIDKLAKIKELGDNPYPYKFDVTHHAGTLQETYAHLANEEETQDQVQVAGRVMSNRNSGMFIDLQDVTGRIQIFSHTETLTDHAAKVLDLVDLGDWIGVKGTIRRTKRGELTINAKELVFLSKAILPLPEKYHGLADIEKRYRQRYLDLIVTEESRIRLRNRSKIIQTLRSLLIDRGFLEVETPMLQTIPGGAAAKPFITHHNTLDMSLYLRIAPELFLKRLIIGGLSDKVFELNRCFRNEGLSPRHNPEFTMVEMYQAFADYHDLMDLTEDLISGIAQTVFGTMVITYGDQEIDFTPPWNRQTMVSLVQEKTGVDFSVIKTDEEARVAANKVCPHIKVPKESTWGQVVALLFEETVEEHLVQPTHVIDLPLDISPLAKVHQHDPRLTERFETFVNRWEVANAFSELNDPLDQFERFKAQVDQKNAGAEETHPMDEDFITALEHGMPPTGGLGIGIDRLVMLLTNAPSIRDVIAFPTMRLKE
jgi:lysyl-tRNA synthetase class 2